MGILASVLIFAGLTLLATAVYDSFTDVMRVIGLFLISAIMLTAGRLGMRKEKNAFFLSLTGCGVGAVYISLFLTYGYFGLINEIVLYLLLAVWSVVVYFIGGKGSQLFKIIGQLGILVSLVFGNVQFLDGNVTSEDVLLIYMLMIFYIATSAFYLFIEWKKGVAENLPALIINIIGTFFLYHAAGKLVNFIDVWAVVLTGYLIAAYLLMQVWVYVKQVEKVFDKDKDSLGCWLFSSAALFVSFLGTLFLLPKGEEWVYGVCSLGFLLVFWLITEQRRKEDAVRTALLSEAFFYGVICCFTLDLVADIFGAAILALPLAVAAYLKKDGLYLTLSMVAFCVFAVFGGEYEAPYVLFVVIFVLLYFLIMLNRLEMYKQRYKILLYVGVLFTLFSATDKFDPVGLTHMEFQHVILYLGALICALATLTDYSKSWVEKGKIEKEIKWFLAAVTVYWMLALSAVMYQDAGPVWHALAAAFLLFLVVMNIPIMIRYYREKMWCAFYIGIKLTLYLVITLGSYDAAGYVVSLCCLIMAIATIGIGFKFKYRYIRLYGLILSIVSIVKLVLLDVEYNSTMARAVTVTVCGLIAFGISFLYNVIDKKITAPETETDYDGQGNTGIH